MDSTLDSFSLRQGEPDTSQYTNPRNVGSTTFQQFFFNLITLKQKVVDCYHQFYKATIIIKGVVGGPKWMIAIIISIKPLKQCPQGNRKGDQRYNIKSFNSSSL